PGDCRRRRVWLRHHRADRTAERNGVPSAQPPRTRRLRPIGLGRRGRGARRGTPGTALLPHHGAWPAGAGRRHCALSGAAARPEAEAGTGEGLTMPGLSRFLVRAAAPIVPADVRADWIREWEAELAFARSRGIPSWR